MESLMNQLAREVAAAIAAAVAADARVEACREKAREAGYDMRLSLDASVGFTESGDAAAAKVAARKTTSRSPFDMTVSDRRFLKSLRIAADETAKEVE
jgi:hypothetical protein